MNMKILKSEKMLCTCCMEEHEVKTVQIKEQVVLCQDLEQIKMGDFSY